MDQKLLANDDDRPSPSPCKPTVAERIAALLSVLGLIMLYVLGAVLVLQQFYIEYTDPYRPPEISIVVDGCSGLGNRVPRAFNFTVAVDNAGSRYDVCVGGDAVVLYGGVPLATGRVEEHCVPPRGAGEVAIRAASGGVGLPSKLAELMADEERSAGGVVRLEVRVVSLKWHGSLKCKASLLGMGKGPPAQSSPCERLMLMDESDGIVRPINP